MQIGRYILFLIFSCSFLTLAANPQQEFAKLFQTSRIYFPDENSPFAAKNSGRYAPWMNFLFQNLLAWVPTGAGREYSEECSPDVWGRRLLDPRVVPSVQLQGALIQKYFRDCTSQLETGHSGYLTNLVRMMTVKLRPQGHPFMHRVVFSLPGNVKLKGLLALKGDFKKRPLVVFRLGVFSNVEEFLPERTWLMMLFEQAPFNVLVLENMSGSDFIADNSRFAFGGYDEGLQNILVAQILKDPNEPLSRLVESLHLFGVSLGGHGVFFASLLNELNSPKGRPLYQSFATMCPVVNIEPTMNALTSGGIRSAGVDLWARKRLSGLPEKMPSVQDHDSFAFLRKTVSEVARSYHGGLSYVNSIQLPPGMTDSSEFWVLNDFWKYYKNVSSPVLVMSTHEDPVVPFALNSQELQNKKMHLESSNISIVDFPEGVHCTLPISYDWKALSSLLQSYILSHSPGFSLENKNLEMEVDGAAKDLKMQYTVLRPEEDKGFVKVAVKLSEEGGEPREMSLNLPISEFDFRFLNEKTSESEQWMLERWVNQNLRLRIVERNGKAFLEAGWSVAGAGGSALLPASVHAGGFPPGPRTSEYPARKSNVSGKSKKKVRK